MLQDYLMYMLIGACMILMVFLLITSSMSRRRKFALLSMTLFAIILMIANNITYSYNGSTGEWDYWIVRTSKFLAYFMFLVIIFTFNQYLIDLFFYEGKEREIPKSLKLVEVILYIGSIMLIVSQFTGIYYTYDSNNAYQRKEGYIIAYAFPLISLSIQLSTIVEFNKRLRRKMLLPLILFVIMPIIAGIIQFFVHGVSLTSIFIVAMVVLLYCFSILDTNELVEIAHKREVDILIEKQNMVSQTTAALVEAIDAKDNYTHGHSRRVAEYSVMLAKEAGKSKEECDELYLIALLHDVGKIGIPDAIINKEGKLTVEERKIIQTHTTMGNEILSKISISKNLSIGAHYHHERYDGKGYPEKIKGNDIPEIARIIAVADSYDAMASKRSYREALPQEVLRSELQKGIGTQFDPLFAQIMIELIDLDTEYQMRES